MSRRSGVCVNCQEKDEIVAWGLCRTCYQKEWRERSEVRPDKYSKGERRRARKIRKVIATLTDAFEDAEELGLLESLDTKELLRDLIQQLVGRMRKVVGESLLERLERDLEPAPQDTREYDENADKDEDDDGDDGFVPS
jgi:hypothetical protein